MRTYILSIYVPRLRRRVIRGQGRCRPILIHFRCFIFFENEACVQYHVRINRVACRLYFKNYTSPFLSSSPKQLRPVVSHVKMLHSTTCLVSHFLKGYFDTQKMEEHNLINIQLKCTIVTENLLLPSLACH